MNHDLLDIVSPFIGMGTQCSCHKLLVKHINTDVFLLMFKFVALVLSCFSSLHQLLSIFTGEWEALAFSAPSAGFWDAVSTALTSYFNLTCCNKHRCYSFCTENDETLYYTPSNKIYFISPSLSLEWCGKLHWLSLSSVKIRQWQHSKQPGTVKKGKIL